MGITVAMKQSGDLPRLKSLGRREREDSARKNIAYIVVAAYVFFLAVSVAPAIVYFVRSDSVTLEEVKELSASLAVGVSSLSGVLGFVLGYYFKASEDKR